MGDSRFQSIASKEPRLARLAAGPQPAWLWSTDGSQILWCNDAAAAALGVSDPRLLEKPRSLADPHGRQVAHLAGRLASDGAPRLERLRGFGARLGQLSTCACSRFETSDGESAILLVGMQPSVRMAPPATLPAPAPTRQPDPIEIDDRIVRAPVIDEPVAQPPPADARMDDAGDNASAAFAADQSSTEDVGAAARAEPEDEDKSSPIVDRQDEGAVAGAEPSTATGKPLRFVWRTDADGRFSLHSDEFLRIAGERTARLQGRAWNEVAHALGLDPQGRVAQAIAEGETWSGIVLHWPVEEPGGRARVELSGMPMFDGARTFAGYRGFGLYRHAAASIDEGDAPHADGGPEPPPSDLSHDLAYSASAAATPAAPDNFSQAETEIVEPPQNVVPFPTNDARLPSLSAVENNAFDEIARRLTQKFDDQRHETTEPHASNLRDHMQEEWQENPGEAEQPAWLAAAPAPARGDSTRDRMLLDLMPSGILIYRLDRLLYANRPFLERTGFENLHALQEAGGLDALYVEPGPASAGRASDDGLPLRIAPSAADRSPSDARLHSILWDGETAHALILQATQASAPPLPVARAEPPPLPAAAAAQAEPDGTLEAILDTATDGIVLFDRSGAILSTNRSAEALFGIGADEFKALNFADLFAADSQRVVLDYFESLDQPQPANPLDHGREVHGRPRAGGSIPLSMTMGCSAAERYFAVFRDLSQLKKNEQDLLTARRKADRAATARTDALAGISHEIRGPLNTIIGFANIMIEERFGGLGNERYIAYLKDIRASGERAIAILDDAVNISNIETGNLDLKPVSQNLNEMVEQCVGALQPQANRERVIIRTSLAHALPQVMADTQALRQITMNIVTSSIRFSKAGGQVIVSTATGDNGGAILRVRDTGRRLSEAELGSVMGSHSATAADRGAIDLSLARALAEANRAQFQIKTTENAGTLIEVAFANMRVRTG